MQTKAIDTWKIGAVKVTRVIDIIQDIDLTFLLPEATSDNLAPMKSWLQPYFLHENGKAPLSIHTFLVQTADTNIIVDTCIGNDKPRAMPDWNKRQGSFLEDIAAAGAGREAIDVVLCTHLHVDHVGWNTMLVNDQWVPTFPAARYLFGKDEWAYWKDEEDPFGAEAKIDSILPIVESDQVDLVESDHQVTSEVSLIPTPGHTPGHVSVKIESEGQKGVITGDLFHHPVQFARPGWKDIADVQSEIAEQSRMAFMEQFEKDTLVLGTHFAAPTAGRIIRDDGFYRFEV
ncbi:MAG: MBL fold metallo-hydrolase [Pseudomonadales bacterium]|nr:MBL fold metallo-hydrolase [Pseudomonadales bacterium]